MKNSSNCMISNTKQCHILNLKLSRGLNAIQYFPTSSCVSWLNGLIVSELSQFSFLITNTEMVLEKSVYSPSNHVTSLLTREYFILCGIPVCLYRNGTADDSVCHVKSCSSWTHLTRTLYIWNIHPLYLILDKVGKLCTRKTRVNPTKHRKRQQQ